MKALVWKTEYECGHPVLDAQHRFLFEFMNKIGQWRKFEAVTSGVAGLLELIEYHFRSEEGLMKERGLEDWQDHKRQHDASCQKLRTLWASATEENFSDIYLRTCEWVEAHIVRGDTDLRESAKIKLIQPLR